ncbi:MAG: DHHA1 domain-containing protein, partial [candidate division Zixibacteria bacterium]|nr:DHHA1 domain-containing protein [candidate division Zixibacteria bacterium]
LFSNGVQAGALLKEIDDTRTKVSLRSRRGFNVSELAKRAGGGGHKNAAGCTMTMPLIEAKMETLKLLRELDNGQAG